MPDDFPDNEIKPSVGYINRFIDEYGRVTEFVCALSRGDVQSNPPRGGLLILSSLKNLHAGLKNLTWRPSRSPGVILSSASVSWEISQKPSTA